MIRGTYPSGETTMICFFGVCGVTWVTAPTHNGQPPKSSLKHHPFQMCCDYDNKFHLDYHRHTDQMKSVCLLLHLSGITPFKCIFSTTPIWLWEIISLFIIILFWHSCNSLLFGDHFDIDVCHHRDNSSALRTAIPYHDRYFNPLAAENPF